MSEKRLLIVDHDAFQRHLVHMLLAAEHFSIQETESAADALKYLQKTTPDLIMAEASLVDMPATDLCQRIKSIRRLHRVPVVLFASPSEVKTIKELAPVVGADLVLEKPLGDKGLREHIKQLLAKTDQRSSADIYKTFAPEMPTPSLPVPTREKEPVKARPVAPKTAPPKLQQPSIPNTVAKSEPAKPSYPNINLLPESLIAKVKLKANAQKETPKLEPRFNTFETVTMSHDTSAQRLNKAEPGKQPFVAKNDPSQVEAIKTEPVKTEPVKAETPVSTGNPLIRPIAESPHPKAKNGQSKITENVYNPADLLPPIKPKPVKPNSSQMTELSLLRKQVEQLIEENEQLKEAIREFKSGVPIVSSQSYLNAVEELEALRRLTEQQAKQLEAYLGKSPDAQDFTSPEKKQKNNDADKTVWNQIVKGI